MASNWMFNNGLDDDSEVSTSKSRMSRKEAKDCVHSYENHTYGGYAYTGDEYREAKKILGR